MASSAAPTPPPPPQDSKTESITTCESLKYIGKKLDGSQRLDIFQYNAPLS